MGWWLQCLDKYITEKAHCIKMVTGTAGPCMCCPQYGIIISLGHVLQWFVRSCLFPLSSLLSGHEVRENFFILYTLALVCCLTTGSSQLINLLWRGTFKTTSKTSLLFLFIISLPQVICHSHRANTMFIAWDMICTNNLPFSFSASYCPSLPHASCGCCVYVCIFMWWPDVDIQCLPQWLTLFVQIRFLTEPAPHIQAMLAG